MSCFYKLQSVFLSTTLHSLILPCLLFSCLCCSDGVAQNSSAPGTPTAPFPTIENLSIVWPINGDDNANGSVSVRYREAGQSAWIESAPLRRVPAGVNGSFRWENKHAGSIFNVQAGTRYEVELSLTDPDGGNATRTLSASTRPWPVSAEQGIVVTPATIAEALANIAPGDVLVLANGSYSAISVPRNGTRGAPIVLRAQSNGGAIVSGDIRFDGLGFIHIVGLTVEGQIKFNNANDVVVSDCLILTERDGIVSFGQGASNSLIIDNEVVGPTEWNESALGNNGDNLGEGIVLTGPGNVIAFNRVRGFRDGISLLEDSAVNQQSIDIYGNDISQCGDDGIEADFTMGNVRVHHNRVTDCFIAISTQPSLGGPTYLYRNVVYNAVYQAFKLQRSSVGDVLYHNTSVKVGDAFNVITGDPIARAISRNNIFIGGPAGRFNGFGNGAGRVVYLPSAGATNDFNYDGFGSIGTGNFTGRIGSTNFNGLLQLQLLTTEWNAVQLDLNVFNSRVTLPSNPVGLNTPPNFELAAQSPAVDGGVALAGFNDGFTGDAPDLGAYERGRAIPVYGVGGNIGDADPINPTPPPTTPTAGAPNAPANVQPDPNYPDRVIVWNQPARPGVYVRYWKVFRNGVEVESNFRTTRYNVPVDDRAGGTYIIQAFTADGTASPQSAALNFGNATGPTPTPPTPNPPTPPTPPVPPTPNPPTPTPPTTPTPTPQPPATGAPNAPTNVQPDPNYPDRVVIWNQPRRSGVYVRYWKVFRNGVEVESNFRTTRYNVPVPDRAGGTYVIQAFTAAGTASPQSDPLDFGN